MYFFFRFKKLRCIKATEGYVQQRAFRNLPLWGGKFVVNLNLRAAHTKANCASPRNVIADFKPTLSQ